MSAQEKTRVIFRAWPDGDVLALFPDIEEQDGLVLGYEHVGQHGEADYAWCMARTKQATPKQYAKLKRELTQMGYDLTVVTRG